MNRAERRRRHANATPQQRRILEQLARIESVISEGTELTIGPVVEDHNGVMKPCVAIGALPHMITHSPSSARELAAMFEGNPEVERAGIGWIATALRESADEAARMALALTTEAGNA